MLGTALRRLAVATAGALIAVPFAGLAPASAVTVPGCFGAATTFACDITVTFTTPYSVGTTSTTIPVCVSICTDVPVTLVSVTGSGATTICVSYEDRAGNEIFRDCRTQTAGGVVDLALDLVASTVDTVTGLVGNLPSPQARVCRLPSAGVYVYDRNTGETLVDLCFTVEPTICDQVVWGFEVEAVDFCGL